MDIYKVNKNLPRQTQINNLNDMILELEGVYQQGKYDKNEIDQIISDTGLDRKFLRNQGIGNTVSAYTGWSHLKAEDGFSIWKYSPTTYVYNSLNKLYFDDKAVENRGEANSEDATAFDLVYLYNGDSGAGYTDNTTEAGTEGGTEFSLMDSLNDYVYMGESTTFTGAKFEFQTRGSNYTLKVEYYSGESGVNDWVQLTANVDTFDDDTSNFGSNGKISWVAPTSWEQNSVNSQTKYWIRISTTTTPVTTAKAYYIIPGDSVISLLAMSSTQLQDEDWAWCSYSSSIYVTIRNIGESAYEGDYHITSTSSAANLKNFFVYNHPFTFDYEDSSYYSAGALQFTNALTTDHTGSGIYTSDTVGEDVSAGQVLYMESDGVYYKADGSAESGGNVTSPAVVMAMADISADASGNLLHRGYYRDNTWNWTIGGLIYLSNTSGNLTQTKLSASGEMVQILGYAVTADIMYFEPNMVIVEIV